MQYLKTTLWLATIIFVGYYFFSVITQNWQQLVNLRFRGSSLDLILLVLSAAVIYLTNSLSWHLITKALGMKLSYWDNLQVWVLSNVSRFIPGAIWQYAGRIYLAGEKGMSKTVAAACLQIEALFTLFAGSLVILLILNSWVPPDGFSVQLMSLLTFGLTALFLLVFTNRGMLKIFSHLLEKILKKEIYLEQIALPLPWLPTILASFLMQFVVDGAVLFFLTRNLVDLPLNLYPIFIAVFAISWMTGYLSFFAPSGLGVQEVTMTALLILFLPIPAALAVVVAVLFRLVLLISEISTVLVIKTVVARS